MATVNGIKAAAKSTGDSAYRPLGTVSVADGDAESEIARDALLEAHALGDSGTEDTRQLLLVTLIASVGTILEWFDFACFGYFASTFSQLFFPAEDKVASLAATFGVFAGAFVMRPVGGVLFGYIGDRHGRKRAVLLSVFLMAGSTFAMGCLPTYSMVGPIAPILLTVARCMQGISTGGQLAGSFCFVVEIAGPTRGAFFGAVSLAASVIGTALGSLCAAVLHMPSVISEEALQSWGWRVPFLLGLLVGVIAHLIKDSVHEGAAPDELAEAGVNPFKAAITSAWREILLVAGTTGMWSAGFYVITTWVPTFASNPDLIERPLPDAFGINTALMLFSGLVLFPSFGYIATKFTPQATMQGAAVAGTLLCLPSFGLIIQDTTSMLLLGQGALVVVISAYGAPLPSWMVFNTPRQCRYTVIGLGYNLAHATVGGTAPIFSTLLLRWTGSAMSVGLYFGILCVCSGSLLAWNTRSKARRNDIGGDGGGAGGGGRRGYAQLDRASTFDDERDDEIASVGANRRLGQFGDEEVGGISPPTADARATTVERRADANSGTSKDETTSYNAATEPRGDTVDVDERQSLIVAKVPPLPDRAFIEHASDKVLPERHEFVDRPLPLPPPPTPSTERPEMESLDEVASLPGPTAVHSVTAAVVDTHHQDDLDLHCTTPFDEHIHWNNKHGTTCGGHLDVDMNASDHNLSSTPIENMVWDDPPPGRYRFWVENNTARTQEPTPFVVRLTREGELEEKSFSDCEEYEEVNVFELDMDDIRDV